MNVCLIMKHILRGELVEYSQVPLDINDNVTQCIFRHTCLSLARYDLKPSLNSILKLPGSLDCYARRFVTFHSSQSVCVSAFLFIHE